MTCHKGVFGSSSMSKGAFVFESTANAKDREKIIKKKKMT